MAAMFSFLISWGSKKKEPRYECLSEYIYNLKLNWILFIPCIFDGIFHDTEPTNCTDLFLRYLFYNITLNIATCCRRQGTNIRESNQNHVAWNQISHSCTHV